MANWDSKFQTITPGGNVTVAGTRSTPINSRTPCSVITFTTTGSPNSGGTISHSATASAMRNRYGTHSTKRPDHCLARKSQRNRRSRPILDSRR